MAKKTKKVVKKTTKVTEVNKVTTRKTVVKGSSEPLDKAIALFKGEEYQKALKKLQDLRKEGEWKVLKIKDENINIRINKQLNKEGKKKLLDLNKTEMASAKGVAAQNRELIQTIILDIRAKAKFAFEPIFEEAKELEKKLVLKAKEQYVKDVEAAKKDYVEDIKVLDKKYENETNLKDKKADYEAAKISYNSKLNAARNTKYSATQAAKEDRYQTYQTYHEYLNALCLNKVGEVENSKYGWETYRRNFILSNWLTKNALLLIVLFIFIVMLSMMLARGSMKSDFFLTTLTQIAPKIFFALGVAGLILLGGTDLSIGRLTAVGASFTLMILTDSQNSLTWFPHLYTAPFAVRVILALVISIALCTLFTSISGFFTAKFKMHPFISTLAMQLIVYGFFQAFFSSVSAFTVKKQIQNTLSGTGGWLLVLYAVIAIIVVWFIWNKTKFGKNLYAVGGNPEAAAVSGINPFKITMLAFVMAGVLYGLGGFVQALQGGSANFNSYSGSETDAIAACVIGGISFSGGVGSVLGAVGGAVILGFLTACFTNLKIDTNIQFVIKGIIILTAVTLDCVKYIRKK